MASVATDPRLLGLKEAVSEISQACEGCEGAHLTPFFLVVGAGISAPAVPLARSIIDTCQGVARRYERMGPPPGSTTLDEYSFWFSRAYPGARQRQQFLRSLIERRPLSVASLRLAHLLSSGRLTNVVVTTNFDDFIARALRLFGQEPAVCDHPRTVGRIDRESSDVQIVHVHGSYLFYDCANLRAEVNGRAKLDEATSFTMVGLLDSMLWNRSAIVVGYSGWEGDVIMSALNRRLRGGHPLAHSIYWFCYHRDEFEKLPEWIRDNGDVRFVVPPEGMAEMAEPAGRRATAGDEPAAQPALRAVDVFDELNRKFEVGTPKLFTNPLDHLANSLQTSLPEGEGGNDPYAFKALIERLRKQAREFTHAIPTRGLERTLEKLREVMRASDYANAVQYLASIIPSQVARLGPEERKEVLSAARLAGSALLAKLGSAKPDAELASILIYDGKSDDLMAEAPPNVAWIIGSRVGQYGYELVVRDKPHGAFTLHLVGTLSDPGCDRDGDGRISLLEAAAEASRRMAADDRMSAQSPVVGGPVADYALFASKSGSSQREDGTLRALLVGVGKYRMPHATLAGPPNDVAALARLLQTRTRALFKRVEIVKVLDENATRDRVVRELRRMVKAARANDVLLFHFSGHAGREPSAAVPAPRKGRNKKAGDAGVPVAAKNHAYLAMHDFGDKGLGLITQLEVAQTLGAGQAQRAVMIFDF